MSTQQLKTRAKIHSLFAEILLRYSTVNQLLEQAAATSAETYEATLSTFNAHFWPEFSRAQDHYHTDPTTPEVMESHRKAIIKAWEEVSKTMQYNTQTDPQP